MAQSQKYLTLQNDSVYCVRRLVSYALYQLATLPKVTPFAPRAGQIGLKTYLEACKSVVNKYLEEASALSDRYTTFNQEWRLCQDNLKNAIATAKTVSLVATVLCTTKQRKC